MPEPEQSSRRDELAKRGWFRIGTGPFCFQYFPDDRDHLCLLAWLRGDVFADLMVNLHTDVSGLLIP